MTGGSPGFGARLIVVAPGGRRNEVAISPVPFFIGRHRACQLVLHDTRVSRRHARVTCVDGQYRIEDIDSRHGIAVNDERVRERVLEKDDEITFCVEDTYRLIFVPPGVNAARFVDAVPAAQGELGKLRALVELARTLEGSLAGEDVLASLVDAAIGISGAERAYLYLTGSSARVGRDRRGSPLPLTAVPEGVRVTLPMLRLGSADDTVAEGAHDSAGTLILVGSKMDPAALPGLAFEVASVLETAKLLGEQREKRRLDQELVVARDIQQNLLPPSLPETGWFRAAGASVPSQQVGGDYYDVRRVSAACWCFSAADVSGKGVSAALMASLLQGAFLIGPVSSAQIGEAMTRVNEYLFERSQPGRYATLFYGALTEDGLLRYANAGHCAAFVVEPSGATARLEATAVPLGLVEGTRFEVVERKLAPGAKVVVFSDGLSEAQNESGDLFEKTKLPEIVSANRESGAALLHAAIWDELSDFSGGAPQPDDVTLLVVEYAGLL